MIDDLRRKETRTRKLNKEVDIMIPLKGPEHQDQGGRIDIEWWRRMWRHAIE